MGFLSGDDDGGTESPENDAAIQLRADLASLQENDELVLADGLYILDTSAAPLQLGVSGATVRAADGARPILTDADGNPPALHVTAGATVRGLWFGGARPESDTGARTITVGVSSIIEDCTLFGYINGIQIGEGVGSIIRRNRLVRCGLDPYHHPIYVATDNTDAAAGVLVERNIVIGGQGYALHLYHQPGYSIAQDNFIAECTSALALQGDEGGPVSGLSNIIWSASGTPLYYNVTLGNCDGNLWRVTPGQAAPTETKTFDSNIFTGDAIPTGTNPISWDEQDIVTNLGATSAAIDSAVSALIAAFDDATAETIHEDATVETHFAALAAVLTSWAGE